MRHGISIIVLSYSTSSAASFSIVRKLRLELGDTKITSANLAHVAKFEDLEALDLSSTKVSSLTKLAKLTQLKSLTLSHSKVTGAGFKPLAGLGNLELLEASYVNVTDTSLEHLHRLQSLRRVLVLGTKVTQDGIAEFSAAVPYCDIVG